MMTFLNSVSGWVILLLGLAISIGLHEIGHLWPAKKFGVKVTKYMIGFGPTLFSRKRGDTEYGIKAIPLGGYIQMIGMLPPSSAFKNASFRRTTSEEVIAPEDVDKTFYRLAPWKKLIIMFGGPFANLLIALVLSIVLLSGFGQYGRTTSIQGVVQCVPTEANPNCDQVGEPSPSATAGLKAEDQIVEINGTRVKLWSEVESIMSANVNKDIPITVLRSGVEQGLTIQPVEMTMNGVTKVYLGVYLKVEKFKVSPVTAVQELGNMLVSTGQMIVQLPVQAINAVAEINPNVERDQNGAISIVGLGQFSGDIASNSEITLEDKFASQLALLMSLNVALFVFNMIPLVPLDGGHIAAGLYEWAKRGIWRLRGKKLEQPVDTSKMMPLAFFVAGLLLLLSVVLIVRDIVNPLQF
ncbi:MAG: PDZ domain-containing protein [Microbacteriaceae bacterium]|nr:PDZ domain-containing protein [Microbacteriaceae bacterium]